MTKEPGMRLYFSHFSLNKFLAGRGGTGWQSQELKKKLKHDVLRQVNLGRLRRIESKYFPLCIEYIFITTHAFDVDNYNIMAKYITDCLVFRTILIDDNPDVINEYRVSIRKTSKPDREGCLIRFKPNNELDKIDI